MAKIRVKKLERIELPCAVAIMILASSFLVGCGGSEGETVAQAPAAAAGGGGGAGGGGNDAGYGADGYDGGGYGGGSYDGGGGYDGGAYDGGGYDGGGYDGGGYGGGMGNANAGYAAGGYGGGMSYDGGSYGAGGYAGGGYGGGMAGQQGPNVATMIQFVRTNCSNCHNQRRSEGDMRLDNLHGNFADMKNATKWQEALKQLEAGTMPPPNFPRRPDPRQQQLVVSFIKDSLEAADFVPLEQQDYLTQAKYAFAQGKENEALTLMYAHAVAADDESARELLSNARWYALGPRPAMTLRFAVGVDLDAPSTLEDIKPLGSKQMGGGGGGGGGYGGGGYGGGRGADADTEERTLQELTGDFGEAFASAFESRWSAGAMGTVFNNVVLAKPTPANAAGGYGGGGYGGRGYGGGSYGGGGYDVGGYGGGGYAGDAGAGETGSTRKPVRPGDLVAPGLIYIGTGSQIELLEKAAERGVDGLFIFDVEAKQNRRMGIVNNSTRLRLMTVEGKGVAATSTLVNTEIERAEMRGTGDDTLQKNIDRLFGLFDEKVKLTSLPPLKPEHAHNRLRQLFAAKDVSNLSKLYEARLYHSMNLLTDDELSKVYQIVLRGNDGLALVSESLDDRRLVLDEILQ